MITKVDTAYPSQYETEVILRDGSIVQLRPIRVEDVERWLAFANRLSPHSRYLRFHYVPKKSSPEDALRSCTVDYNNTFAIVAELLTEQGRDIIADGRYFRLPGKRSAEVAFTIDDAYQGKGIGTRLVEWLVHIAREKGIHTFEADVLGENRAMMAVFRDYGFHVSSSLEAGTYHVVFPISPTSRVLKKEEDRERLATVASLRYILHPRSVAVIGASRKPGTIGQLLLQCLMHNGFWGTVYPVNPSAEAVISVRAYPSVLDIPGEVDLAIVAVPAPIVAKVAGECGHKGVRALVVISDGFEERGPEGVAR
ncbi:MAG TPA: GNAT family N-acetyltransferase, partial [Dehalococcoidales bacterium]